MTPMPRITAKQATPVCVVFDVARVPAREGAIKLLD
jgi:hypothetical protein